MIVVSDTSPLTVLLTVGEADLLPKMFHEVSNPDAVRAELLRRHPRLPAWLRVAILKDNAQAAKRAEQNHGPRRRFARLWD